MKSTQEEFRFNGFIWEASATVIKLTPTEHQILQFFLENTHARLSADELEVRSGRTPTEHNETAYRTHIYKIKKKFGFSAVERKYDAVPQTGPTAGRRAVYGLSADIDFLPEEPKRPPRTATNLYRQEARKQVDDFIVRPVIASGAEFSIEKLYVELFLRPSRGTGSGVSLTAGFLREQEDARSSGGTHRVTAESLLVRTLERSVIVGPPGTGKTTLLKWLNAYLLNQEGSDAAVPLLVSLRSFASELEAQQVTSLLEHAVFRVLGKDEGRKHLTSLRGAGDTLRAMYLLDGWDEVPIRQRAEVLRHIDQAAATLPVLITTRVSAASSLTRHARTSVLEIGALADEAVAELCSRLGAARGRHTAVPELLALIENSPGLWALAGNPYLLTLLCEIVFKAQEMPTPAEVSPYWVLSEAVELIRSDYNATGTPDPLTGKGLERITKLAHNLSFGRTKRTTFEPDAELNLSHTAFLESPEGRSRFFNALELGGTSFAFTHLRMQEFLAAQWAGSHGLVTVSWLRRFLSSRHLREEAQFAIASQLASQNLDYGLRSALRELVLHPDQAGESIRCVSRVLSTAGIRDGGESVLGIDLRQALWSRITSGSDFLIENTDALLELDPEYILVGLRTLPNPGEALLSHLYRYLPLGLRRTKLDPEFAVKPLLSWLIGLPGRGFLSVEELDEIGSLVADGSGSVERRIRAMRDLGSARAVSQVSRIIPLLEDRNEDLASAAAETLGKIGGRAAAVALANVLVNIDARFMVRKQSLSSAVLNALAFYGYGALEPHSRELILGHIRDKKAKDENLAFLLEGLAGTPLPQPPQQILQCLRDPDTRQATRLAAARVLPGVLDPALLDEALHLSQTEPDRKVREALLDSVPWVPLDSSVGLALIKLVRGRQAKEAALAVRLLFRTVARYPQHTLVRDLASFVEEVLDELASVSECSGLQRQVLDGARYFRKSDRLKRSLLKMLANQKLAPDCLALAVASLAEQRLTTDDLEAVRTRFEEESLGDKNKSLLVSALATTLFAHRPEEAPQLLHKLRNNQQRLGDYPASMLLVAAQRSGHLIYDSHVVLPDGSEEYVPE